MPIITSKYGSKTTAQGDTESTINVFADGQHIVTLERNDNLRWQGERGGQAITSGDAHDLLQWIADDAEACTLAEFAALYPAFQLPQAPAGPVLVHVMSQHQAGRPAHPLFAHIATPQHHPLRHMSYSYSYPEATETGVGCGQCADHHGAQVLHASAEHVAWCYSQQAWDDAEHAAELRAERGYPQHMVW